MRPLLATLLFVFSTMLTAYTQSKELIDKGDKLFMKKDYTNALKSYLSAGDSEDADTNFRIGLCYLYTESKSKAVPYLEKAYRIKPAVDLDIQYHLGLAYQNNHQYALAKKHYEEWSAKNRKLAHIASDKIQQCIIGDSLTRTPVHVKIENIGDGINTPFHEYSPLVTSDGNMMVFTSNRTTDNYKAKSGTNFEDIYITYKNNNGWGTPEKISSKINIKYNDAAAYLSGDGNTLILYYEDGAGDLYIAQREGNTWTEPTPLNKNINTPMFWETSASLSADGKKIFFSSNRPGGKGDLDIWMSERDAKGEWGKAVNLGPTINTSGTEDSPYIHPDGVTLYFSSNGHPSMGSNDIFMSEYKDGRWQKPVNLGYPINSIEYDGFFTISEDKKTGYYSAIRPDGLGSADIYKITFLPPPVNEEHPVVYARNRDESTLQPDLIQETEDVIKVEETSDVMEEPTLQQEVKVDTPSVVHEEQYIDPTITLQKELKIVTILKGQVIDELTAQPLAATIILVNNETNTIITRIKTKAEDGAFEITIPHGGNYGVSTEKAGYLFNSINFNLPQFAEYQEIDTHIIMVKAEIGSKVILKNVFFDIGKADLKPESIAEVENIKALLLANPGLVVQINGHTDNTGNAATNKTLSLKRATSVVQYLIEKGISESRLSAKGFGSERPIVSNDDEDEGRAINRRTEIEILDTKKE
jgi:outer membrane protein OmpA-like peptidoglycan-associated protein